MKKKIVFLLLFMSLGIFFVLLPYLVSGAINWSELSKSIGFSLFILAGLQIMEVVLGGVFEGKSDPIEQRFGLAGIYKQRSDVEPEIAQKLRKAKKIKILSNTLAGNAALYQDALKGNLGNRTKAAHKDDLIKMILIAPDADALYHRAVTVRGKEFDRNNDPILSQWIASISVIKNLEQQYKDRITVRLNANHPFDSVFILDEDVYVTPYVFGRRGTATACLHFVKKGHDSLYKDYEEAFDQFWDFLGPNSSRTSL